jgi:hypothetical protein
MMTSPSERRGRTGALIAAALLLAALAAKTEAACPDCQDSPLAPYPLFEQMMAEIAGLAEDFPGRVELIEYGRSVEGRPLLALHVGRPGERKTAAAFIGGNIHGNEWIGNRMAMAVARLLLAKDGQDELVTQALDLMDFFIVPSINPDGYARTSAGPCQDDNRPCRKNANGVDLNRNFPLPGAITLPIEWAGSPDPDSINYRGPAPLSEPETAALDRFFADRPEIASAISFHSYAGVIYPAHCETAACVRRYREAAAAFSDHQPHLAYPRVQSRFFDTYTGEMEDWLHHEYGVLAIDVEIGRKGMNQKACGCQDLFWTFNPKNMDFWIDNDARASIAYSLAAHHLLGGRRMFPEDR